MSKETKNIIIMTQERSGSNLLCRLFSEYDCMSVNTEIADWFPQKINERIEDLNLKEKIQKYYPYKSFDKFVESMRYLCDRDFMIFKMFQHHITKVSWKLENQNHSSFIILTRNILDSYLSYVPSRENKIWSNFDTTKIKVNFIPHKFIKYHKNRTNYFDNINKIIENSPHLKSKAIKVDYKEFMYEAEQDKFMEKIFNFLKIKYMEKSEPKIKFAKEKQNKNKNFNFVINKQEMLKFMKSNEVFKKILNESVYSNLPI